MSRATSCLSVVALIVGFAWSASAGDPSKMETHAVGDIKDLKAEIHAGSGLKVTAKVYVPNTAVTASLVRKVPQGLNPKILLLNLETKEEGIGLQVLTWVDTSYIEAASKGQFTEVSVLSAGQIIGTVKVDYVE